MTGSLYTCQQYQYHLPPPTMKLINIKILIISILCSLLIFIKVKKLIKNSENHPQPQTLPLASISVSNKNKTRFTPKNGTLLLEDQIKDFSERRRHIAEMCGKYKADIGESPLIIFYSILIIYNKSKYELHGLNIIQIT